MNSHNPSEIRDLLSPPRDICMCDVCTLRGCYSSTNMCHIYTDAHVCVCVCNRVVVGVEPWVFPRLYSASTTIRTHGTLCFGQSCGSIYAHTFTHSRAYLPRWDISEREAGNALAGEYPGYLCLVPRRTNLIAGVSRALITPTKFSHFPLNVPFVLMNDLSSYLLSPRARAPELV